MWGYQGQGNSTGNNYSNKTSLFGRGPSEDLRKLNKPTGSGNKLDYRPQLGDVRQLNYMENQDFNPMRQRAMSDVEGSASSNYAGLVSNLARSGGVTQADRMNAMRERGKQAGIGNVQVGSRLAEIESGSRADVERHNKGLQNEMYRTNLDMQNRATEFNINNKFASEDRQYNNLWEREKLQMQMDAAAKLAAQLGFGGGGSGGNLNDYTGNGRRVIKKGDPALAREVRGMRQIQILE